MFQVHGLAGTTKVGEVGNGGPWPQPQQGRQFDRGEVLPARECRIVPMTRSQIAFALEHKGSSSHRAWQILTGQIQWRLAERVA
jgi:hypothetical protein